MTRTTHKSHRAGLIQEAPSGSSTPCRSSSVFRTLGPQASAPFRNSPSVPVLPEDPNPGDDDSNDSGDDQNDDYHDPLQVLLPASPAPSSRHHITDTCLADALTALGHGLKHLRPSSVKICMPDTFDSASPQKLREFLVSCNLVFHDRPDAFEDDSRRIRFIISYLKGAALDWFEPALMDPSESAHWMWDFEAFILELEDNFSLHNPAGDAETALTNLSMKDSHHITKYVVEFNKLAARIDWNEPALRDCFYHGLPLRLHTEVLKGGKPLTLAAMRRKAQECDQIHWMTRDEIACKPKSAPRPAAKDSDTKPSTSSSTNMSKPLNTPRPSRPGNPAPSSASSSSAPKTKPDLTNKLGKDGKLNSDERKRRMDNVKAINLEEN
ncbi:hypothetical protein AX17_005619 [Amanita inopinata Kibby_2008]|nr:hypothetical protein AX17_005619 [Amanita inopinata Kibby_2008]